LTILTPASESESNDSISSADALALEARARGAITAHYVDFYKLTVTDTGRLTAQVHASGFTARLSLLDASGNPLLQSRGQSASRLDPLLVQTLTGVPEGATYYLEVESRGGLGDYTLTTDFLASRLPTPPIQVGDIYGALVAADLNDDGYADLVTANL